MENADALSNIPKKDSNIELLRIISAVAVIMIHVIGGAVVVAGQKNAYVSFLPAAHILLKWSVPVFLMISGYCILGKKESCDYKWVLPRVGRFACALVVFGFSFAFLERFYEVRRLSFSLFGGSFLDILNGNLWDHMWYVYCIIGIYLALPVLHAFASKKKENIVLLTALCFVFSVFIPNLNRYTGLKIDFYFPFIKHLFYVCFGALVAKYPFKNDMKIDIVCIFAAVVGAVASVFDGAQSGGYYNIWVCLTAMAIFVFFMRRSFDIPYERIRKISSLTWGAYLIHPLFINIIYKLLKFDPFSMPLVLSLLLVGIVVSAVSFAAVYVLKKIPLVSKML